MSESSTPSNDRVWVVANRRGGARSRTLHTDEDCYKLRRADEYYPADRSDFPGLDLCRVCTGEAEVYDGGSSGPHELLKQRGESRAD